MRTTGNKRIIYLLKKRSLNVSTTFKLVGGGFSLTSDIYYFAEKFYAALLCKKHIFTKDTLCGVPMLLAILRIPA